MSDAPIGVTAVIALAILVLSFLIPGWAASALGLTGAHAHLLDWIRTQEGLAFLALWLVYELAGLCMLLVGVMAVVGTGTLLARALLDFLVWALRTSAATALLLGHLMFWPLHVLAGVLRDILEDVTAYVAAQLRERRELRRLYREDFARDFPTFRAFLRSIARLRTAKILNTRATILGANAVALAKPRPGSMPIRLRSGCSACPRNSAKPTSNDASER